jgi:hypothetical protein
MCRSWFIEMLNSSKSVMNSLRNRSQLKEIKLFTDRKFSDHRLEFEVSNRSKVI